MPNIPGADARQSRTLQSLDRFTPDGITALAAVGLLLLDAINKAHRLVNEAWLSRDPALACRRMVDDLYDAHEALHWDTGKPPTFLSMVEEVQQPAESEEAHVRVQRAGCRDQGAVRLADGRFGENGYQCTC
jgi:hypothetical protein